MSTIDQIHAALEKVDNQIFELQLKRSHLRSKLNTFLSATRNLPNEILSEIFRLSAAEPDLREPNLYFVDIKTVLKVGSICSHWRRVSWSSPHLWVTSLLTEGTLNSPSLVTLSIRNSQSNPVSVGVDLDFIPPESEKLIFEDYSSQVGSLRFHTPMQHRVRKWNRISTYFTPSAHWAKLEELWVWGREVDMPPGLLFQTPDSDALQFARREHETVPWHIPVHQLTVLRLHHLPIDQCLHLLLHCSSLREFHCFEPGPTSNFYDPMTLLPQSHRPKYFDKIEILNWKVLAEEWNAFCFSSMRFPNLRQLRWGAPFLGRPYLRAETMRSVCDDFLPSMNKIVALDLDSPTSSSLSFIQIFSRPNFHSLQQLCICASTPGIFTRWLENLTLTQDRNNNQHRLPKLRILYAQLKHTDIGGERVFHSLSRFLSSRRSIPPGWNDHTRLEQFILDTDEVPLQLEQGQIELLRYHILDGLNIQLILSDPGQPRMTTLG